jgi:hypothetical protein
LIASTHLTEDTLRRRAEAFRLHRKHMDIGAPSPVRFHHGANGRQGAGDLVHEKVPARSPAEVCS